MSAGRWVESVLVQTPARVVLGGAFLLAAYMKLFDRVWAGNDPTLTFAEARSSPRVHRSGPPRVPRQVQ